MAEQQKESLTLPPNELERYLIAIGRPFNGLAFDLDGTVLDDGIFSGESLYMTGLLLAKVGANVLFATESVGNTRRIGHMMNAGGADPDFIMTELIQDLVRTTPFARAANITEFRYQAERGGFNLVKKRVKRMLATAYPKEAAINSDPFSRLR